MGNKHSFGHFLSFWPLIPFLSLPAVSVKAPRKAPLGQREMLREVNASE